MVLCMDPKQPLRCTSRMAGSLPILVMVLCMDPKLPLRCKPPLRCTSRTTGSLLILLMGLAEMSDYTHSCLRMDSNKKKYELWKRTRDTSDMLIMNKSHDQIPQHSVADVHT
jgi:hypothetical protein